MKFLMTWYWANENALEVRKRYSTFNDEGKYKTLYPTSTMIGRNMAFMVFETDDIAEVTKLTAKWTDVCTFDVIPIMDSNDLIKIVMKP